MTTPFDNDEREQPHGGEKPDSARPGSDVRPEPPIRWNPDANMNAEQGEPEPIPAQEKGVAGVIGSVVVHLDTREEIEGFKSARRFITASQIIAIVSLFFGGILLSALAVVCAVIAYSKLGWVAACHADEPEAQRALKRSGVLAIAVACVALALNAVSALFLYPMVLEAAQTGDLSALFGSSGSTGATGTNTTWG